MQGHIAFSGREIRKESEQAVIQRCAVPVSGTESTSKFKESQGSWSLPSASYLQTGLLREQVGAAPNSSYFYGWHGAADVQIFISGASCFHQGNAV